MLIQHSGSLAGGYREGIDSQHQERGKKTHHLLHRVDLKGERKRCETLIKISPIFHFKIYILWPDLHVDDKSAKMS